MNTVIFGGSFNPVHNGHLEMLTAAGKCDFVDRIFILPDSIPPHKEISDDFQSGEDRLNMCTLLSEYEPKSQVSDIEIKRGGKSYMYDTVREFEKLYPEDKFFLLVGGDMAVTLDSWYKADKLLEKVTVLAVGRNTVETEDFNREVNRLLSKGYKVLVLGDKISPISSTEVRQKLKKGETDIPVPEKIKEYIESKKIYKKEM